MTPRSERKAQRKALIRRHLHGDQRESWGSRLLGIVLAGGYIAVVIFGWIVMFVAEFIVTIGVLIGIYLAYRSCVHTSDKPSPPATHTHTIDI